MHILPNTRKVIVSRTDVALFNRTWPCSKLRNRSYWFAFDTNGSLVDTNLPEQDDGPEALALSQDCQAFLDHNTRPTWAPE